MGRCIVDRVDACELVWGGALIVEQWSPVQELEAPTVGGIPS